MGRYVALAFGLVTLVIAVDTASGRRFGCSASPPDACYTCPMPNFAGGNACEVVAGPVACPTPCASPAYDACDSVSAAVSEPQTAAEPSSDDNEMPPPTEQASSAPDESSTRAAGSLQADPLRQPAASASPAAPAEQEQATNDGPDRYSERLPQATPSTRPLFRSPSNEGLLPTPADQPATRESASSPSNNDDRYGQPTPVLEETPFLDEPTELAPADETRDLDDVVPSDALEAEEAGVDADESSVDQSESPPGDSPEPAETTPTEQAVGEDTSSADSETPAEEAPSQDDESTPTQDPSNLTDEDFFGQQQTPSRPTHRVSINLPLRQWTDATGLYQCEAALVEVASTGLTLQRPDGPRQRIAWSQLSTADLHYVREHLAGLQVDHAPDGQVIAGGY